ncbi:MAG TPA: type VI secretion system baseplate subunit TssG [Pyrinomonadaceae bacterium]|jgi:type VI secretion system protein ImpH|nr:type VI secretion system baseplate subunit TssG [Pyrinomonadaceae bacterium]
MEWLFAEGNRFDFFQAVRLLEILYSPEKSAQDEGVELDTKAMIPRPSKSGATSPSTVPDSEKVEDFVRFKSAVGLNFPASDISQVRLKEYPQDYPPDDLPKLSLEELQDSPPITPENTPITEMTVNLMGLAGALGPLDMPTTELIIERAANKDKALKDFLDIFNHRLISLLYRIRKMHRIGLEDEPPGQDKISKYLFSIIGLGTDGLMGRMMVRDRSLLHYAGLLSQQPRSIVGLERILSDYFKVQVKGHQFVGGWYDLDESQWTKIGEKSGQNNVLGKGAVVVGKRVWDQQAKIEIQLGPLTYQQFPNFIPTGWGYRALCDLTRFYLGDTLDVSFRLILKGEEIPLPMLGMINEPVLGWTSWLTSYPDTSRAPWVSSSRPPWLKALPPRLKIAQKDDSQVVLQLRALPSEFKSEKLPHFFNLPPAQLDELIRRMKVRIYTRFETIINQGDYGDSMFAIRSGSVRVTRREENGKETTLSGLGPKECFGEMSLLLGKNREVTVIALERCEILELSRSDFDQFAAQNPRWSKTLKAYRYGQFV